MQEVAHDAMEDDLFEDLHNLEDTYYQDGYRLGVEDGSRAGRIEGRTFGLEKGFEKFFSLGKLHGKSQVLMARIPDADVRSQDCVDCQVKTLSNNARLEKHVRTLFALTELESLSTSNDEDAVSEFDDRFKRAVSKAKVIENIIGGREVDEGIAPNQNSIERGGVKISRTTAAEKNMEDFGIQRDKSAS